MTKNMITLTFSEMQTFINYVVDNIFNYGYGYKDVLVQYCIAKFYGKVEFASDNIADIYDNEYQKLYDDKDCNINTKQFGIIMSAIDNELDRKTKFLSASMVMSDANEAIATLVDKISKFIDTIGNSYEDTTTEDIKAVAESVKKLKDNINADTLVRAMIDNGVIKGKKKKTTSTKKENTTKEV